MTQPEALRLAVLSAFRGGHFTLGEVQEAEDELNRLIAQRDALLEALRDLVQLEADGRTEYESAIPHWDAARAAIAKAEKP